jgi:hypothetical protein
MKSLIILILFALVGSTLVSCNKEYTCRCKDYYGNQTDYGFTTTSRKKAKSYCEDYNFPNGDCDLIYTR